MPPSARQACNLSNRFLQTSARWSPGPCLPAPASRSHTPRAMVSPHALRWRPARVLGHRPQPPPLLRSPDESAPRRRARGDRAAAAVRRPARRRAETTGDRARAASPGAVRSRGPHGGDHHRDRPAVLAPGPEGGGRGHSGRDAARGRRHLPGAPGGRRRPVERLSRFLLRVDGPSTLGGWSYEVLDAKLARAAKGEAVLQLLLYSDLLAREQGVEPAWMHLALGGGDGRARVRLRVVEYAAYYPRGSPPFRGARRRAAGNLPGTGRSLRDLRMETILRGPTSRRRPPLARRRHHAAVSAAG